MGVGAVGSVPLKAKPTQAELGWGTHPPWYPRSIIWTWGTQLVPCYLMMKVNVADPVLLAVAESWPVTVMV